jgi:hypothetical protein
MAGRSIPVWQRRTNGSDALLRDQLGELAGIADLLRYRNAARGAGEERQQISHWAHEMMRRPESRVGLQIVRHPHVVGEAHG